MDWVAASVDFGVVGQWVAVVAILAVAWRVNSGGGGAALDTLDKANHILERRLHEYENQAKVDANTILELRGSRDVAVAIEPLLRWSESHERRAQERHEAMLTQNREQHDGTMRILELIAKGLGPEPNGRHA